MYGNIAIFERFHQLCFILLSSSKNEAHEAEMFNPSQTIFNGGYLKQFLQLESQG